MSQVTITIDQFYERFPQFNDYEYSQICPQCLCRATSYISVINKGRLNNQKRELAIYLLAAHLSQLTYQLRQGQNASGIVSGASVDGVSVNYVQIPNLSQWSYWLSLTPYGQELLFLLNTLTAVPQYFGGSFERVY